MQLETAGISATGIEPQDILVNHAKKNGINVITGVFPDFLPDDVKNSRYDLISMNEVIYYFPDLKRSLATAHALLTPEGILYIKSYIGENDVQRYHQSLFSRPGDYLQVVPTRASFQFWLDDSGFEVIEIIPVPDEYFSLLTGVAPEKSRFFQHLFNMVYGRLILNREYWLSRVDRMVIIARKKRGIC